MEEPLKAITIGYMKVSEEERKEIRTFVQNK